mgnify:CR=1 FL=1
MRNWLIPLAIAAFAIAPAIAPAMAEAETPVPQLQANGSGEVMVVPDIAIVTIGVVSRATDASDALDANSVDLTRVINAIKAAGVAEKDIGTSGFGVNPVYQRTNQPSDQPAKIVGYEVSNQVRVTIRDITASGGLLDKVVKAGANQVYGISFDIADRKAATEAAIRAAIADARAKAELMAEAAGVRLVRILTVNANENGGPVPMMARADFAEKSVPVMPGERAVSASASISWEIAPQ